jgi:ABC-type phosphate/phosphonate transport system substrate-binding protein
MVSGSNFRKSKIDSDTIILITSFRMYNAVPGAARAWRALFERVFDDAGVAIDVIEHRWPDAIADLWAKPDLCGAFMCGWPFMRSEGMQAIAAPVPSPARYAGLPRYCSEFLVREERGWTTLEETFGHRFGWMAMDSQSGFNAPRAHLAQYVTAQRPSLYAEVCGPLGAPMKALEALKQREVDVTALDGFFLDLCRHHEPARLDGIRCVATTAWTPIPLLVAAPGIDREVVERLRCVLVAIHAQPEYAALLADALVARFVVPDLESYGMLDAMARESIERGYEAIR